MIIKMRGKPYITFILIVLLMSCGRRYPSVTFETLNCADSLMFSRPDSALILLNKLDEDRERLNAEDKARFALLMTQAESRNYIVPENDSLINVAIRYYARHDSVNRLAWCYLYASDIYDQLGNDSLAINYIKKAYETAYGLQDSRLLMYIHYFWGNMIEYIPPYEEAIEQLEKARNYAVLCNDTAKIVACLNEIGTSYMYMKDFNHAEKKLYEALPFASYTGGLAPIYHKLALMDYKRDNYRKALYNINEAINSIPLLKNYGDSMVLYSLKGFVFAKIGELDSAKMYLKKGFSDSSSNALGRYYLGMSNIQAEQGHYEDALMYYRRYASNLDSMYNSMLDEKALEWQKRYDMLKLEGERDRLKIVNRDAWLLVGGLLILVLFLTIFFMHKINRSRQTLMKIKNARTAMINESISMVQNELNNLLRDKEKHIDRMTQRLYTLDRALSKAMAIKDMDNLGRKLSIKNLMLTHEDMESIKMSVDASKNGFVENLTRRCPMLTDDDINLCCLIKLGLSRSDIAVLLNISDNTLKQRKGRLKSKLGISESLDEWILANAE